MPDLSTPPRSSFPRSSLRPPVDYGSPPSRLGSRPSAGREDDVFGNEPATSRSLGEDVFGYEPMDSYGSDSPYKITVEPTDNLAQRTAVRIGNHFVDLTEGAKEKGPGRLRRVGKLVAQTLLPPLIAIGSIVGVAGAHSEAPVQEPRLEQPGNAAKPVETIPEKPKSPLEQAYEKAKVEVFDHPFGAEIVPAAEAQKLKDLRKQNSDLQKEQVSLFSTPDYLNQNSESGKKYKSLSEKMYENNKQINSLESQYEAELSAERAQPAVDKMLQEKQARFKTAIKLSSGVKVNFYTSDLDNRTEPLDIDPKALDVMFNELLARAETVENSPIASDIPQMKAKAARGELNLKLSIVVVSDEKLCISGSKDAGGSLNDDAITSRNDPNRQCRAIGLNARPNGRSKKPSLNQVIIALDSGPLNAQGKYSKEVQEKEKNTVLTPDQGVAVVMAHEMGHALFGATDKLDTLTSDQEHAQFVDPLESKMFSYYCDLSKQKDNQVKLATPLHVDNPEQSDAGSASKIEVVSPEEMDRILKEKGITTTSMARPR